MAPRVPPISSFTIFKIALKDSRMDPSSAIPSTAKAFKIASAPIFKPSPQSPSPIFVSHSVKSGSLAMTLLAAAVMIDFSSFGSTLTKDADPFRALMLSSTVSSSS
ncbi:unnamed protein product [[Candida] boidinii]|nr:unnamed protein product [[Candida] boidinii]